MKKNIIRSFVIGMVLAIVVNFAYAISPNQAEARHHDDFGRRIERRIRRDTERNITRFFDRLEKAYADDYINGTKDRLRIKRQARNRVLREIYQEQYSRRLPGNAASESYRSFEEFMTPQEQALLDRIEDLRDSDQPLNMEGMSYAQKSAYKQLCRKLGIEYTKKGFLLYFN